jgi:predicted nucleic acid-binding protein
VIVVDANILVRFVLGRAVRHLIETNQSKVRFFTSEAAFLEAAEHLPSLLAKYGRPDTDLPVTLEYMKALVEVVSAEVYDTFEWETRARLRGCDEEDWHVIAAALALGCPVWGEDKDFLGTGIAVWITGRVEVYFKSLR